MPHTPQLGSSSFGSYNYTRIFLNPNGRTGTRLIPPQLLAVPRTKTRTQEKEEKKSVEKKRKAEVKRTLESNKSMKYSKDSVSGGGYR
jgi:hypothetical protein